MSDFRAALADLVDSASELAELMQAVRESSYKPDSFTLQPIEASLTRARAALAAPPAPVAGDAAIEDAARLIYGSMRFDRIDSTPDWTPGGNSFAQDEARRCARAVLARQGWKGDLTAQSRGGRR